MSSEMNERERRCYLRGLIEAEARHAEPGSDLWGVLGAVSSELSSGRWGRNVPENYSPDLPGRVIACYFSMTGKAETSGLARPVEADRPEILNSFLAADAYASWEAWHDWSLGRADKLPWIGMIGENTSPEDFWDLNLRNVAYRAVSASVGDLL